MAFGLPFCFIGSHRSRWTAEALLCLHHLHIVGDLALARMLACLRIRSAINRCRNGWISCNAFSFKVGQMVLHSVIVVPLQKIGQGNEMGRLRAQLPASLSVHLRPLLVPPSFSLLLLLLWQNEFLKILVLELALMLLERRRPGHATSLCFLSEYFVRQLVVLNCLNEVFDVHLVSLSARFLVLQEFGISRFGTWLGRCARSSSHLR